jgi:hypothetical protein
MESGNFSDLFVAALAVPMDKSDIPGFARSDIFLFGK